MKKKNLALLFSCSSFFCLSLTTVAGGSFTDEPKDIFITFDGNGGAVTGKNVIKTKSNVVFKDMEKPTATREGYANDPGWVYGDDKIEVTDTKTFSENTVLKANWKTYTVTFDAAEGKFSDGSSSKTLSKGRIHSDEIEIPTCENKAFEGWYINDTKQTFPYQPVNNATLTAKYTNEQVDIVVTANGGYFGSTTSDKYKILKVNKGIKWSELSTRPDFPNTINHPDSDSIFSKWQHNGEDLNPIDTFNTSAVINATYENAATVTFNVVANNGEWQDSSTTTKSAKIKYNGGDLTYGQFKTAAGVVDSETHHKTGNYELLGWFDDQAATNDAIADTDKVTTAGIHNLYASYKNPFNINYQGDTSGYTKTSGPDTFIVKDNVTIKLTQKTGYTLASTIKIYKDSQHQEEITSGFTYELKDGVGTITIPSAPNSDLYIVPTAPINRYNVTVTAESNRGTVTGQGTYDYNTEVTCTVTPHNGYTFNGWYVNGSSTAASTETTYKFNVTATTTIVAKFNFITYNITYKDGNTTLTGLSPTSYNVETTTFNLPNGPTKANNDFVAWYSESTLVNKITSIEKGTIGDKTFYANYLSTTNAIDFENCEFSKVADAATEYENGTTDKIGKRFYSSYNGNNPITSVDGFVGKRKKVMLNGKEHTIRVIGVNHDLLATQPYGKSGVKALFTWQFETLISDSSGFSLGYLWSRKTNQHDYTNSALRYALTGEGGNDGQGTSILVAEKGGTQWSSTYSNKGSIISQLPNNLTNCMKSVIKGQLIKYNGNWINTTYSDRLFTLSAVEVGYTNTGETGQTYYSLFSNGTERIHRQIDYTAYCETTSDLPAQFPTLTEKTTNYAGYHAGNTPGGNGGWWHLRTPLSTGSWDCYAVSFNAEPGYPNSFSNAIGIAPGFCM